MKGNVSPLLESSLLRLVDGADAVDIGRFIKAHTVHEDCVVGATVQNLQRYKTMLWLLEAFLAKFIF